ncbi:MAG: hypothetical protein FJW40_09360 [Acidobacteria bacterium]|nr:hypothetical protein [Acidobacteriota bacterium]
MTHHLTRREAAASALAWLPFRTPRLAPMGEARFHVMGRSNSPRRYFHVHGNESTARQVLRDHLKGRAGLALLVDSERRNVPLAGGQLDPNRMFSREGAGKNLKRLNPAWTEAQSKAALDTLDRDRDRFLKLLLPPPGGLIIAMHNNSEGYSMTDEIPISDKVSVKEAAHPREFMLATDPADFEILSRSIYNVVLQQKAPPDDDGSLSRLCAARGIRYVNIEASLGLADKQRRMIEWLDGALPARR